MKKWLIGLFLVAGCFAVHAAPQVVCGKIVHIENFKTDLVVPRNVDIWLPEGYDASKKYAVLYMHDGQNIFDPNMTWNKQSWDVDDTVCRLLKENKLKEVIVVGISSNSQKRQSDYFPQKPYERLSSPAKDSIKRQLNNMSGGSSTGFQPNSDKYLAFIVSELKPYIDKNFSVYTDRAHTFMAGSSMGGLISIYALCEYPDIFGGVACLSTHWLGTFDPINPFPDAFVQYLKTNLPAPSNHTVYFDHGDQSLDASYPPFQEKVDATMKLKGYTQQNWETSVYKGKDHSEPSWRERFGIPLMFLLGK